ncbi:hypothetical protein RYX36_035412, partial [Vicia faba]
NSNAKNNKDPVDTWNNKHPGIDWVLIILCIAVASGFENQDLIENANVMRDKARMTQKNEEGRNNPVKTAPRSDWTV